jgi:hypothetical protein
VIAVPLQKVRMGPINGALWLYRATALVYEGANPVWIIDLSRDEDFQVVGKTD